MCHLNTFLNITFLVLYFLDIQKSQLLWNSIPKYWQEFLWSVSTVFVIFVIQRVSRLSIIEINLYSENNSKFLLEYVLTAEPYDFTNFSELFSTYKNVNSMLSCWKWYHLNYSQILSWILILYCICNWHLLVKRINIIKG